MDRRYLCLLDGSEPKVALVGIAGYHLAVLLSLSRGLVTSVIAAMTGAAVVLSFGGWSTNEKSHVAFACPRWMLFLVIPHR